MRERASPARGGRAGRARMARWLCAAMLLAGTGAPPAPPARLRLLGWTLLLHENRAIESPHYDECRFYRGRVLGEGRSDVTLTDCSGQLYGLVQVGDDSFVLEPNKSDDAHVVRRRDVLLQEPPLFDLSDDTADEPGPGAGDGTDAGAAPLPQPHVRPRHSHYSDSYDYFRDITPVSRPLAGEDGLWFKLAIVADHTMVKFHGRERVQYYILALMNLVSAIFNDPSLNSNMTLVINKLYLYEERDSIIKYGNARKSLEAVNKWNYRHLAKLSAGGTGWDAAVWLTRAPIGGPAGFAPVAGVCTRNRSAAINRDEGLTSAFVIAHELAHLLGLTHDEGDCISRGFKGSVMARTVLATLNKFTWSWCSRKQFHEKSKRWWCLRQRNSEDGLELGGTKELANYGFTVDEQCRTEFGEGFSVCKSAKVRSSCARLWCAHRDKPHVCKTKLGPPLEGTPCGDNRWCVKQECEKKPGGRSRAPELPLPAPPEARPPAWDQWGPWSPCSASCGYGLQTSTRQCLYQGTASQQCEGASSQVSTCWAGACAAHREPRASLCTRHDPRSIPYVHDNESRSCEAWCVDFEGGQPSSAGAAPDGVPCSYDRPFDICYQGSCVRGQCNSSDSGCNWCPGGFCVNNTYIYTRTVGRGWARMTVIPHEARLLSVHISTPVALSVAIQERKRDRHVVELRNHYTKRSHLYHKQHDYLRYDPNIPQNLQIVEVDNNVIDIREEERFGYEGSVVAAGALLHWKQTDNDIFITATARIQSDFMIMAIQEHPSDQDPAVSVQLSVNYSSPAGRTRPLEYRWSTERGPCSASCGGGVRLVQPRCVREHACPPPRYEHCNLHSCEFSWVGGEWEECSATCGDAGTQERQLYCVPANMRPYIAHVKWIPDPQTEKVGKVNSSSPSRSSLVAASQSPARCAGAAPDRYQPCNRIPCPVYWRELPWTPCSATCGRGVSRRPLVCGGGGADGPGGAGGPGGGAGGSGCGPRPRERRRRCRLRRCPPAARRCRDRDVTQYCDLFTPDQLRRTCTLPTYSKYCCNACQRLHQPGAG